MAYLLSSSELCLDLSVDVYILTLSYSLKRYMASSMQKMEAFLGTIMIAGGDAFMSPNWARTPL